MLQALCGNKNIEKILVFLFVNEKCYGTQLSRQLHAPLTPLQKALLRLEKGRIIFSFLEGKTRYYKFNPSYPLLTELQELIKKTYTLLPANEKKRYLILGEDVLPQDVSLYESRQILLLFWEKLGEIKKVAFHAKSHLKEESGWNGKGSGEVSICKEGDKMIFTEKGSWENRGGTKMDFSNIFRWTLDRSSNVISLEHMRRGPENPTFLFYLTPTGKHSLSSIDSHLCGGDIYFGRIFFDTFGLKLNWRAIGPKKNEEIDYFYS